MRKLTLPLALGFLLALASCQPDTAPEQDYQAYLALSLDERQSPQHATGPMAVAEGLQATLFAAEPQVVNPTNLSVDAHGRVWVCESYNYAVPEAEQSESGGRISILTDTDGDGVADDGHVYYQGEDVNIALGITVLGKRVFVARSPHMLVFTDEDGDDLPDRKDTLFTGMGGPGDHSAHALVFGPDGRYYFNYGNAGNQVLRPDGQPVLDQTGRPVISNGKPYHGGMVFRFEEGGKNFEVLGHNFRNNYEVCIDAYGTLWQSDNDDDGNRGVRINYVMEYGNYGYLDELTGDHWARPRTGMAEAIPQRHWHQNDPGVVPNLLITGAGSPAGITVYEGELLPEEFRGELIHTDAGPNIVRAYPAERAGAGFIATEQPLMESLHDPWFRPVDVATAPDGSLLIADWYDPVVGGGAAGDHSKGRIFRLAPPSTGYAIAAEAPSSTEAFLQWLQSPNEDRRYQAFQALAAAGEAAEAGLKKWWEGEHPIHRARALWLLARLPEQGKAYVQQALEDEDARMRIVGIRAARQQKWDVLPLVQPLLEDADPAVRREVALALRYEDGPEAAQAWATLASQHDGTDRWYLEALGIGADPHWEAFFAAWKEEVGAHWKTPGGRDIVWRARTPQALPLLAQLVTDPSTSPTGRRRYFRAFDFHQGPEKNQALLSLLATEHPEEDDIRVLALQHLNADEVQMTAPLQTALAKSLSAMPRDWQFVALIDKYDLTNQREALLEIAADSSQEAAGPYAARLLLRPAYQGESLIRERVYASEEDGQTLMHAMRSLSNEPALSLMQDVALDDQLPESVRKAAVVAMGQSWWGEDWLLETVKDERFPEALKPIAASILFSVYRTSIHEQAAQYLDRPGNAEGESLPPLRDLVATVGNVERGRQVFTAYCQTCHVVAGQGVDFGPNLSEIGDKLSREGLYRTIIYPSEGINSNFEAHQLELKEGGTVIGLLQSENDQSVTLKLVGGSVQTYERSQIARQVPYGQSLMPNLSQSMSQEQLVDLVSYLETLQQASQPMAAN